MRKSRGCNAPAQMPYEFEGEPLSRCPVRLLTGSTWGFLGFYQHYRRGFLLRAGGLEGQPYKYLQAMNLIEAQILDYVREIGEKS